MKNFFFRKYCFHVPHCPLVLCTEQVPNRCSVLVLRQSHNVPQGLSALLPRVPSAPLLLTGSWVNCPLPSSAGSVLEPSKRFRADPDYGTRQRWRILSPYFPFCFLCFFTLKYMHAQHKHFRVQKSTQRPLSLPPGSLPTPITLPEAAHLTGSLCLLPDIFCVFGADAGAFMHCSGRQCKQPEGLLTYNNPHFSVLQPSSIIPE